MKKGLLSLLALALTVVGCQNYDDQFAELTSLIEDLQTEVEGIPDVSQSIATLQSTVAAISSAVTSGNAANAAANQATVASLATVSQTLADLQASLGNVAQAGDLDAISSTLADVQADVRELLEANAVINQDITINNAATLEYVETLISTAADDPNVIVNGKVLIDTRNLTDAEVTRASAVAAKLATILGDGAGDPGLEVISDSAVTFTNLAFIDDDYTVNGADQDDAALRTVSGNLSINHNGADAALDYSQITSVGDVTIAATTASSATSVNFSGVDGGTMTILGQAAGVLNYPRAATVDLGTFDFGTIDAASASSINSDMSATTTNLIIEADVAGSVTFNSLEDATHTITVNASSTTNVFFNALDNATGAIDAATPKVNQFHIPALAATGATLTVDAGTINAAALATIGHATDFNSVGTAILSALTSVTAGLTIDEGPINLPNAAFSAALTTNATTVHVAADTSGTLANVAGANVDFLTVGSQAVAVTDVPATLVTIDITASGDGGATHDFTVTNAAAALRGVTVNGFDVVTLGASGAGTGITTVTTGGTIRNFASVDNASLAELNIAHTWDDSYTDAQVVDVIGNTSLTGLNLASVARLEACTITGNTAMTSIMAPSGSDPLTPGATTSFTISGNSLTATYTYAVAAVQDGINNTPYVEATIEQASLESWKDYFEAIDDTNTVNFSLDYDASSNAGNTNFASDVADDTANTATPTFAGTIDTDAELAIIN
ncbi:MAG: beta strand repeat-containing protein [Flavobacteriaceae bacterium]